MEKEAIKIKSRKKTDIYDYYSDFLTNIVKEHISYKIMRTKRHILNYSKEQKQTFNSWLGISRYIYNNCLDHVKKSQFFNKNILREKFIHNKNYDNDKTRWMLEKSTYELRDQALEILENNINSLKNRLKVDKKYKNLKMKDRDFKRLAIELLKYKSKKLEYRSNASISILSRFWNPKTKRSFYYSLLSKNNIKKSHKLPDEVNHTIKIIRTPSKRYEMIEPYEIIIENQDDKKQNMVFIDPGSKIFLNCYDPEGKIIMFGHNDMSRIGRLLHCSSKIQSKKDKTTKKNKKTRLRKALLRNNEKIRNLVKDLHRKASKFLCENYSHIYIPKLNFHTMTNLGKRYKMKLKSLKLCSFVDCLMFQATKYNSNVKIVTEEFTSKTCGSCGTLGKCNSKRIFHCKNCNVSLDRDDNGSRNIMIKYFTEQKRL
jgi:putative transposase